jgi:hypothetical protein
MNTITPDIYWLMATLFFLLVAFICLPFRNLKLTATMIMVALACGLIAVVLLFVEMMK